MNSKNPYQVFLLQARRRETAKVNTLFFNQPLEGAGPGQFVMVWLPRIGEKPFCVADDSPLTITVSAVGTFSRALHEMDVGERVWVRGPYGQGFSPGGVRHLLVGGGYGAAPLFFLAKNIIQREQEVMVCLGARSASDILLADAFRSAGCQVRVSTDDGSSGLRGQVTQLAESLLEEFKPHTLYACGPLPMLSAAAEICREKNLPAQLSYEALIRCGIGLCGSCELDNKSRSAAGIPPGWLTCRDGPVFFMRNNEEN